MYSSQDYHDGTDSQFFSQSRTPAEEQEESIQVAAEVAKVVAEQYTIVNVDGSGCITITLNVGVRRVPYIGFWVEKHSYQL